MALLIAARRTDIASIRTVVGNLDTDAFTCHHGVTPLAADSNPLRHADALAKIPQIHWLGQNDTTVPPQLASCYPQALGSGNCTRLETEANASHSNGWERRWNEFLNIPLPCAAR